MMLAARPQLILVVSHGRPVRRPAGAHTGRAHAARRTARASASRLEIGLTLAGIAAALLFQLLLQ